jgi:hypothetical protein
MIEQLDWIMTKDVADMTEEEKKECIGYLRVEIIRRACKEESHVDFSGDVVFLEDTDYGSYIRSKQSECAKMPSAFYDYEGSSDEKG